MKLWKSPYSWCSFFYYGFIGCFVSYMAVYLTSNKYSSVEVGSVFSTYMIGRVALGWLVSKISDEKQAHLISFRVGLFLSASILLLSTVSNYRPLVLILLTFSLSSFSAIATQMELLCLSHVEGNDKKYNRIRLFGSVGFVFCSITCGTFLQNLGPTVILSFGVFVLLVCLTLSLWMEEVRIFTNSSSGTGFYQRCRSKYFIYFIVASICLHISFAPFSGFFTQYLMLNNYHGSEAGVLLALGGTAEIIIFFYAGWFLSRFHIKTLLIFGFLVTSVRWFLQAKFIDNVFIVVFTQVLHAFSFGLMISASVKFLKHYFAPEQHGRGMFMYFGLVFGSGASVGSFITGITWKDGTGSEFTFIWASVICIIGAFIITMIPKQVFKKQY